MIKLKRIVTDKGFILEEINSEKVNKELIDDGKMEPNELPHVENNPESAQEHIDDVKEIVDKEKEEEEKVALKTKTKDYTIPGKPFKESKLFKDRSEMSSFIVKLKEQKIKHRVVPLHEDKEGYRFELKYEKPLEESKKKTNEWYEEEDDDDFDYSTIKVGDYVDFGGYGKLYICKIKDDSFWVTDDSKDAGNPDARGWNIKKDRAERIIRRADESLKEEKEYLSDKVTQVLDDYGILYGDIVENGDGSVNIVGVDEEEWDEVVEAIKAELGLDVLVPDSDHDELDDELIVRERLKKKETGSEAFDRLKTYVGCLSDAEKEMLLDLLKHPRDDKKEESLKESKRLSNREIYDILGIEKDNYADYKYLLPQFRELYKKHGDEVSIWLKGDAGISFKKDAIIDSTEDLVAVKDEDASYEVESLKEEKEEPKLETFDEQMDFLASDEQEAIDGYEKVLGLVEDEHVKAQLDKILEEERAHKEFLEAVKKDKSLEYSHEEHEEDEKHEEDDDNIDAFNLKDDEVIVDTQEDALSWDDLDEEVDSKEEEYQVQFVDEDDEIYDGGTFTSFEEAKESAIDGYHTKYVGFVIYNANGDVIFDEGDLED